METIEKPRHKISCVANSIDQFWWPEYFAQIEEFTKFADEFEDHCVRVIRPAIRDFGAYVAGGGIEFFLEFARIENPMAPYECYAKQLVKFRRFLFHGELTNSSCWKALEFVIRHGQTGIRVHYCRDISSSESICASILGEELTLDECTVEAVVDFFGSAC